MQSAAAVRHRILPLGDSYLLLLAPSRRAVRHPRGHEEQSMRSLPVRLLKIAWSAVLALLILGFGQGVWGVLLVANLKTIPHHPLGRPSDDVGPGADVSIPQREVVASQNLGGATQLSAGQPSVRHRVCLGLAGRWRYRLSPWPGTGLCCSSS